MLFRAYYNKMFTLNLARVLRLRGIENHQKFLIKLGFSPQPAYNFLNGVAAQIKFDQLERLCLALNCTPNDLFEWQPDAQQQAVADTHSINSLKKKDLPALLKDVPLERFDEIANMLNDLKNG